MLRFAPLAAALLLAGCQRRSDPAAAAPVTAPVALPAPPATADAIPGAFLGTWDTDATACAESFSMTRFTVSPEEVSWFGGTGGVTAVRGDGDRAEVDLAYVAEGSPTGEPEPTTTTLALADGGQLSLGLGGGREGLVRCAEGTDRGSGAYQAGGGTPPRPDGVDQAVSLRFAPGTASATVSDTLRASALHDYLVRASAGQRLAATLRASGPGAPRPFVIRESTYRGPGDFDVVPNDAGVTASGPTWTGRVPASGVYRVRVAHSGPSANGGTVSPYALTVRIE